MSPTPKTAVTALIWLLAKLRSKRITLRVATERQKMFVTLHGKGLVPPLIKLALTGSVVVSVVTLCMGQAKPLAEPVHFAIDLRT